MSEHAAYDLTWPPPIIPPYTGADVAPAWPRRVWPWPPAGYRVAVEDPSDPWSAAHLEPIGAKS